MKYRRLGKSGLRVSLIGIGAWQLGGEWGKNFQQDEVDQMFDAARDEGINLVDTAECYGDHASEAFVGKAVGRDREKWIIATKFGHQFNGYSKRIDLREPKDLVKQLEGSLNALKTDYVDLLQYHSIADSEFDNDALTEMLQKLLKSGKIRHLGNSVGKTQGAWHQVESALARGVETIQLIYNRLDRLPEEKIFPSCIAQDLGVLGRVPLASGFLSGKYKPGARFGPNDIRSERDRESLDNRLREVEEIGRNEVPPGVEMAQWALAWCLKHPAVSAVIPGCKNVEQVRTNAKAALLFGDDHRQAWK
jgi:aryl-alcohol dehydrogenase-like predicted oxidoreductase